MKIYPQNLKTIYEKYSNNNESQLKGINKLIDIIGSVKYNDLFIKKSEYLGDSYKITKNDIKFIVEGNKWNTLKPLDSDNGGNYPLFSTLLSLKETKLFEEYQHIFSDYNLFEEILSHSIKKQKEILLIDKDKFYAQYTRLQNYITVMSNQILVFAMNINYPMNDIEKEQFTRLLDEKENIKLTQENAIKLVNYTLAVKIDRNVVLNTFVKFINRNPIIQPNLLKKFTNTIKLFTPEELKSRLPLHIYKEIINKDKSGKISLEVDAKIYKFDIEQICHTLQKDSLTISKKLRMLSQSIESLLSNIDDYVAVNTTFSDLKTCNIYLMYEKDSIQLSRQVTEKLIDYCLEDNIKYKEEEIRDKLEKLRDYLILDLTLAPQLNSIKTKMKL